MIGFTGGTLDRLDHLRGDEAAVARLAADPSSRLLRLDWLDLPQGVEGHLDWIGVPAGRPLALLGKFEHAVRFVAIDGTVDAAARPADLGILIGGVAAPEAALWATARSLAGWHARSRFCAACGHPSDPFRAGWGRHCRACRAEHYPRTDPVVIMLAEHDRRVLVGRQPRFPPGRYSALAGFVEPGESIEEAVARELMEEAGVRATSVRYVASQPWPFPSSLMIGCIAPVADDVLRLDETELEDAFWVTRADVAAALSGDPAARFGVPPPYAIAHSLFAMWLREGQAGMRGRAWL